MIYKIPHRKLKIEKQEALKIGDELRCSGRIDRSCSTSYTRRFSFIWKDNYKTSRRYTFTCVISE